MAASANAEGNELTLAVVNRALDRDLTATIDLTDATARGELAAYEVNAADVTASNSFAHRDAVGVRESRHSATGSRFDYTFSAHSLTVLTVGM